MGKTGKANRTKGNTRPSSSGHTAQLLGFDGQALSGFIGFNSLEKETASYVPVTGQHVTEVMDNTVDSDFRMVMRKMLKRDAVTRLKAMQEFGEYCMEKDKDIVKNVLPFWPRLYNRLALDYDRRIREATHQSNGKLLSKVKREMAPYLKNIMGVWLLGQCDLYPPAASSAQAIFLTTFPKTKQSDAIMFCKTEIFSYFKDNLFEQTAKSMSELNSPSPEDMENKYILVISATIQALKLILSTVAKSELANLQSEFGSIVANNKFWKFSKSKEAQIRGAWYTLISSICRLSSEVFANQEKKLVTTVFGALSESDPMVAPSVWEAALSIVANFENCWQEIDIHKVALPQLWSILKDGGKGNARMLFPCLLPFLSKLPTEIMETEQFLLQFFSCFKQSLSLELVKSSAIECDAIIGAFLECLEFITCNRLEESKLGPSLLERVLTDEILPMIESSFYNPKYRHLSTSKLYPLFSSLIRKIEEKCLEESKSNSEAYSKVLQSFWKHLLLITYKVFELPETEKPMCLIFLSYFFHSLLQSSEGLVKITKRSVRFVEETESEDVLPIKETQFSEQSSNEAQLSKSFSKEAQLSLETSTESRLTNDKVQQTENPISKDLTPTPKPFDSAVKKRTLISLSSKNTQSLQHIVNFSRQLCKEIDLCCHIGYLKLLEEILVSASNEDFVRELIKECSKDKNYDQDSSLGFFQEVVLKSLRKVTVNDESLNCLFNVVLVICSLVTEDEAQKIMAVCDEMHAKQLEHLLRRGLESYRSKPFFRNWIKSSHWISAMVKKLKKLVATDNLFSEAVSDTEINAYLRIFQVCLLDKDSDLLIDDESFENIVLLLHELAQQLFVTGFQEYKSQQALQFIDLVTKALLKNTERCWKTKATENLIYLLFCSNIQTVGTKDSDKVTDMLFEIEDNSIDSYAQATGEIMSETGLIFKMAQKLNSTLMSLKTRAESENILQQCLFLLTSVQKALSIHKPGSVLFVSYKLMDVILLSHESWTTLKKGLKINLLTSLLKKRTFYPVSHKEKLFYPKDSVLRLILACDVVAGILSNESVLDFETSSQDSKFSQNYVSQQMPELIWCLTFYRHCKMTSELVKRELIERVERNCIKMSSVLLSNEMDTLQKNILNLSLSDGSWALCLKTLGDMFNSCSLEKFAENQLDPHSLLNSCEGLHKYITKQVLIPYLTPVLRKTYFTQLAQQLTFGHVAIDEDFIGKLGEVCCYVQDLELSQLTVTTYLIEMLIHKYDEIDEELIGDFDIQFFHLLQSVSSPNFTMPTLLNEKMMHKLAQMVQDCKKLSFNAPVELLQLYQSISLFMCFSTLSSSLSLELCRQLLTLFLTVVDIFKNHQTLPEASEIVLMNLFKATSCMSGEQLLDLVTEQEYTDLPRDEEHCILNKLISVLTNNIRPLQYSAQAMLLKIMPLLPTHLSPESKASNDEDSDELIEKIPSKLSYLIDQLQFLNDLVDGMLSDVEIGDLCTVVPYTDSYVYAMGYLLGWIVMLKFISSSPSQIRSAYANHLEENKLLTSLFSNVFRLMPENPIVCLKKGLKIESPKKDDLKLLFLQPPVLQSDPPSSEEIQIIACFVFATTLCKVPASIRTWWNNLDRKSADIVNGFTSKYISGLLCVAEIQAVHENEKQFENLTVQARPGSREVIATYTIDECPIELCVQLPVNYPLGPINAERRGKVVIGQLEWRHWLMQLTTVLTYQNGSILDGLTIWKRNLDKKFEGVEECMICYYILHNSTLKLPKLSCHVCRKKFHSACLYKWFSTSNNFTCPLCRNEFLM